MAAAQQRRVTLRDVAERAGTSTATVSYVLNGKAAHLSEAVCEKVGQAARELGYVKNALASSLKGMRRGVIAVLVPQFGNIFFTRICVEIERVAQQADCVVSICNSDEDPAQERRIVERLISQQIDGCIICPALSRPDNIALLHRHAVPTVVLERTLGQAVPAADFVGHDNFQTGHLAARQLLAHGHRRVGFAGWQSPIANINDRARGFRAAFRECGLDAPDPLVLSGPLTRQAGRAIAGRLLDQRITGLVIGHHHQLAHGALHAVQDRGLAWPRDLSIVMIGTPEWRDLLCPGLVCIERPERGMGRAAATLLLRKVAAPGHSEPALILNSGALPGGSLQAVAQESIA